MDFLIFLLSCIIIYIILFGSPRYNMVVLFILLCVREILYTYFMKLNNDITFWNSYIDLLFFIIIFGYIGYKAYNLDKNMPKKRWRYSRTYTYSIIVLMFIMFSTTHPRLYKSIRVILNPLITLLLIKMVFTLN